MDMIKKNSNFAVGISLPNSHIRNCIYEKYGQVALDCLKNQIVTKLINEC